MTERPIARYDQKHFSLTVFKQEDFHKKMEKAEKEKNTTINKVKDVDSKLVEEYEVTEDQGKVAIGLVQALIEATSQDGTISPMNFNQSAFQASAAYQVKDEVAANMKGYRDFKKQEAEARKLEKEMEAIYAGLAKLNIKSGRSDDSIMDPNNGDYALTFEGKRKVLGGSGSGTPDGLAPYAVAATDFLLGDIATMVGPDSTANERITAAAFTFIKPIKVLDKGHDVLKGVKIKVAGKGASEFNKDLAKAYLRDIEDKTGRKVNKEQIHLIKEALRTRNYEKLTPKETAKHRSKFTSSLKDKLIAEWEEKTKQKWPRYTEEVLDKNGDVARNIGQPYDAHHIIENNFSGPHEWWNIHPAKYPNEHQAGIHGKGAPSGKLFPRR